jgi:hypothetical protein
VRGWAYLHLTWLELGVATWLHVLLL